MGRQALTDLIGSRAAPVVRLAWIFHQAARSMFVQAAHAMNPGCRPTSACAVGAARTVRHAVEVKDRTLAAPRGDASDMLGGKEQSDSRPTAHLHELAELVRATFPD